MKNLLYTALLLCFLYILPSCKSTMRVTDRTTDEYRDLKISDKILIKDGYAYAVSRTGTPMIIDLNTYSIETLNKNAKNQKFFHHLKENSDKKNRQIIYSSQNLRISKF